MAGAAEHQRGMAPDGRAAGTPLVPGNATPMNPRVACRGLSPPRSAAVPLQPIPFTGLAQEGKARDGGRAVTAAVGKAAATSCTATGGDQPCGHTAVEARQRHDQDKKIRVEGPHKRPEGTKGAERRGSAEGRARSCRKAACVTSKAKTRGQKRRSRSDTWHTTPRKTKSGPAQGASKM